MTFNRVSRARDTRADRQLQENIEQSEKPAPHNSTHFSSGSDIITPSDIGANSIINFNNHTDNNSAHHTRYTDNEAITAVNNDTDHGSTADHSDYATNTEFNNHTDAGNPHSTSQPRQGGTTANRPSSPDNYQFYFDTDLGKPIWYDGTDWVDATGTIV